MRAALFDVVEAERKVQEEIAAVALDAAVVRTQSHSRMTKQKEKWNRDDTTNCNWICRRLLHDDFTGFPANVKTKTRLIPNKAFPSNYY